MKLSKQQTKALELMNAIEDDMDIYNSIKNNGYPRWFHQAELPGITLHSMDALVSKGIIEKMKCNTTGQIYYRVIGIR